MARRARPFFHLSGSSDFEKHEVSTVLQTPTNSLSMSSWCVGQLTYMIHRTWTKTSICLGTKDFSLLLECALSWIDKRIYQCSYEAFSQIRTAKFRHSTLSARVAVWVMWPLPRPCQGLVTMSWNATWLRGWTVKMGNFCQILFPLTQLKILDMVRLSSTHDWAIQSTAVMHATIWPNTALLDYDSSNYGLRCGYHTDVGIPMWVCARYNPSLCESPHS